ncbi:MAG TPA: hypothetical protein VFV57_01900, partial [Limnobacter sp.]|nr:hypothetical protein [Limnobacter sp.]
MHLHHHYIVLSALYQVVNLYSSIPGSLHSPHIHTVGANNAQDSEGNPSAEVNQKIDELNRKLEAALSSKVACETLPAVYEDLWQNHPKLASLVGRIDLAMSGECADRFTFNGALFEIGNELRAHERPIFAYRASQDTASTPIEYKEAIWLVLRQLLELINGESGRRFWQINSNKQIDLTEPAVRQLSERLGLDFEFLPPGDLRSPSGGCCLPTQQRQQCLLEDSNHAAFYAAGQAALLAKYEDGPVGQRLAVASDAQTDAMDCRRREVLRENPEAQHDDVYLPTLCPGFERLAFQSGDEAIPNFQWSDRQGNLERGSLWQALSALFDRVYAHLQGALQGERPNFKQHCPLFLYRAAMPAFSHHIPAAILENEAEAEKLVEHERNELSAMAANVALQQAITEDRKAKALIWKIAECERSGIQDPRNAVLGNIGARYNSSQGIAEHNAVLCPAGQVRADYWAALNSTLAATHRLQDISYVRLPLNIPAHNESGFCRDNQCWMRAAMLSLLCSFDSSEALAARLQGVGVFENHRRQLECMDVLKAFHHELHSNPVGFLHGLRPFGFAYPAGILAGVSVEDLMQRHGQQVSNNRSCESFAKMFLLSIALGARCEENPRLENVVRRLLYTPLSMAEAEVLVAAHRVLNVPCLVVQHSVASGTAVMYNAPREHQLRSAQLAAELNEYEGEVPLDRIDELLHAYKQCPIIILNEEHYSVYLPNSHVVTQSLVRAEFEAQPPAKRHPSSLGQSLQRGDQAFMPSLISTRSQHAAPSSSSRPAPRTISNVNPSELTMPSGSQRIQHPVSSFQLETSLEGHAVKLDAHFVEIPRSSKKARIAGQKSLKGEWLASLNYLLEQSEKKPDFAYFEIVGGKAVGLPQDRHVGLAKEIFGQLQSSGALLDPGQPSTIEVGRFKVLEIREVLQSQGDLGFARRYEIEWIDTRLPQTEQVPHILRYVQVAPPYEERYLKSTDIKKLFEVFNGEDAQTTPCTLSNSLMSSHHGLGRAACIS